MALFGQTAFGELEATADRVTRRDSAQDFCYAFGKEDIMRLRNLLLIATLAAPSVSVTTRAFADEKGEHVVKLSEIPAPAREAIQREAQGAPILKVETEKEGGQTVYEAHVKQGNEEVGIVVDADGTLIGRHSEQDEKE